jgi:ferric-dicitrate binding protein FerR (iron transport regulator)
MRQESNEQQMDDIGRLIRYAGEREQVDEDRFAAASARVGAHWQDVVARRRKARQTVMFGRLAIAAALLVAVGAAFMVWRPATGPAPLHLAAVDRVAGDVLIDGVAVVAGDTIDFDAVIETGVGGRVAVRLDSGQSLRVDSESLLVAHSGTEFDLKSGRVYFDSNLLADADSVYINTPFGRATDVGTQYQMRVTPGALTIGVREGEVRLERASGPDVSVQQGSQLAVDDAGMEQRGDLDSTSPVWAWAAQIAPDFGIEGTSLLAYLEWYTRESGLKLRWRNEEARRYAAQAVLKGSIKDLSIDEGLEVVKKIAPFNYEISGDTFTVSVD